MSNNIIEIPSSVGELKQVNMLELKSKSVGMTLLLFSMAERETLRINRLSKYQELVEKELFDETIIQHLSPEEQIERYQLASQMLNQAGSFVKSVANEVNFDDLETKIMLLENQSEKGIINTDDNTTLEESAKSLLKQFSSRED